MNRRIFWLAPVMLAFGFGAGLIASRQEAGSGAATPAAGETAAQSARETLIWDTIFAKAEGVTGAAPDVDREALDGQRVLVNFWATWCAPCMAEIPDLMALQGAHQGPGFTVLGVALDDAEAVSRHLAASPLNYPTVRVDPADATLLSAVGNPSGALPFSLLVDESGQVIDRHLGTLDRTSAAAFARLR